MKKTNFPERGRNTEHAASSWPERLKAQVERPGYEQVIDPRVAKDPGYVEWPGPAVWDDVAFRRDREAWKKGLRFGVDE